MKRLLLIILFFVLLLTGCLSNNMPVKRPSDFGFILKYSYVVGAPMNIIDTFEDKVTKDLIDDGTITATIKLSDQELTQIYDELRKIGVMKYPETYNPGSFSFDLKTFSFVSYMVTPYLTYDLTIRYGDKSKRIFWEDKNVANSGKAKRLRGLIEDIRKIIESKDEYKKLPAFKGAYS